MAIGRHWRRGPLLLALLGALASCAPARAPLDWEALDAQGRVVGEGDMRGLDALACREQFRWSDGEVELDVTTVGGLFRRGPRLMTSIRGSGETEAQFLVDTGSTASHLSAASPLTSEARVSRSQTYGIVNRPGVSGHLGYLSVVRMGPMVAHDLAVAIMERQHTSRDPTNVLGIVHLFHMQLEHAGGRWWLRSGAARRPPMEPGWDVVPLESGTPLLKVRGPSGQELVAMIDTGANLSAAIQGFPEGEYHVLTTDGRVALRVQVRDTVHWPGLSLNHQKIALLIGMDALSARPCRVTFDKSAWAFPPNL